MDTDEASSAELGDRYWALAESGPRRDPGAHARRALIQRLDERGERAIEVYMHAIRTYERMPPTSTEVCAPLRAAALVALAHADERLAAYEAARLLADVDSMTAEPGLTAVRVLAALGETRLLYAAAVRESTASEVRGECLANLTELPVPLATEILSALVDPDRPPNAAVVVGATDLVLNHAERDSLWPSLQAGLAATRELEAFHYAAAAVVARRLPELIDQLRADAAVASDPRKLRLLDEAARLL